MVEEEEPQGARQRRVLGGNRETQPMGKRANSQHQASANQNSINTKLWVVTFPIGRVSESMYLLQEEGETDIARHGSGRCLLEK